MGSGFPNTQMVKIQPLHVWDVSVREARRIQERLRERVVVVGEPRRRVRFVAGVDASFDKRAGLTRAAVAVLRYPDLALHEHARAELPTTFPYVPGYLSFREIPAICAALAKLETAPDLVLCDGQGYAHPRRFGLACHLGVLLDKPSIGVGKSRLVGTHAEPDDERGSWAPLMDGDEVIGAVLRTRAHTKPVYVSIGHRIGLEAAVRYVMACVTRYRLPETTRFADRLASGATGG